MQAVPLNTVERLFDVFCLTSGLVLFSTLVSSPSSHMTFMMAVKADKLASISLVKRFLRRNQVRSQLAVSIHRQVTSRIFAARQLTRAEVPALAFLSKSLRLELSLEMSEDNALLPSGKMGEDARKHVPGENGP